MKSLDARHLKALKALHEGETQEQAGKAAGVSESAIKKWLKKPLFKAELERLANNRREKSEGEIGKAIDFQAEVRERTRKFYFAINDRVVNGIEILDEIGLSRSLPPLVKAMKDATEMALSTDDQTLGLEQLSKELDGLKAKA